MTRSFLPVALVASFAACAEPPPPPPTVPTGAPPSATAATAPPERACTFRGVVRSADKAFVEGALIAVSPPGSDPITFTKTDHEGRYCVEGINAGDYGFTVTAKRLTAAYIDVRTITLGEVVDVELGGEGFVLRGRAVDDKGAPLAATRLFIPRLSNFLADMFVTETDAEGRYEVKLPAGRYAPSIHADRYVSASITADLNQDKAVDLKATRLIPKNERASDEVVAWIQKGAVPLKTPVAGAGFDDMKPLKAIVGGAEIVALGEATHGTREFFQLKHRMLEFLVEEMGFRSFVIEASFPDCLPLTDYVRTGKGDPAFALANQRFWTWDTEEVLDMVRWMRRYNEDPSHKEKLSFWGFDMQFPAGSTAAVLAYLHKVDPSLEKEVGPALEPIDDDFSAMQLDRLPKEAYAALAAAVQKINAKLAAAPKGKKVSEEELRLARIHARVMTDASSAERRQDGSLRDRSMADITADLVGVEALRAPKGSPRKMVLWAHNGHISKVEAGGVTSMGAHLKKRFGDKYLAFGFAFDEGSFQAVDAGSEDRGLMAFAVTSAGVGGLDHTLARAGIPLFALDLRSAPPGPVLDYWTAASYSRGIGSMFTPTVPDYGFFTAVPKDHFDALLFVQKTTAARSNETGKRGREPKKPPPPKLDDPGFEVAKVGELPGWLRLTTSPKQLVYKAEVADKGCSGSKHCLVVSRTKGDVPIGLGTVATRVDATPYRGKKVTLRASVRVSGKAPGDEAFFFASAPPAKATQEKLVWAAVPGASWSRVSVEVEVPSDAPEIVIAFAVTGGASGAIDDIEVQ